MEFAGELIFVVCLAVPVLWFLYLRSCEKCPSCNKRNRRNDGNVTTLEKEVRYKDVDREVKDSSGHVIKRYKEQVAVNYSKNRYDLTCKECGNNWTVTKWVKR